MSGQTLIEQVLSLENSLEQLARPLQQMLDEERFLRCSRQRLRCSLLVNRIVVAMAGGTMPDVPDFLPLAFGSAAGKVAAAAAAATAEAADDAMARADAALRDAELLVPVADASAAPGMA